MDSQLTMESCCVSLFAELRTVVTLGGQYSHELLNWLHLLKWPSAPQEHPLDVRISWLELVTHFVLCVGKLPKLAIILDLT